MTTSKCVSQVHVDSIDAGRWIATVDNQQFEILRQNDEPTVLDLDLARVLGYANPINIRKLVRRMLSDGKLNDYEVFATVEKTSEAGGRPATAYHLTRTAALLIATQSETPRAWALTRAIVQVFEMVLNIAQSRDISAVLTEVRNLREKVRELSEGQQSHPWLSPSARGSQIKSQLAKLVELEHRVHPSLSLAKLRKRADMEMRAVGGYPASAAHTYAAMPLNIWERAMLHLSSRVQSLASVLRPTQATLASVN